MQDSYHERDSGIGDFEERDSGNNHFDEPRIGMSVDENLFSHSQKSIRRTGFLAFRRRSSCSVTLELLCGNENYIRSEVANLPKILSGPKGNKASKTAASVEMLNGRENPHGVRLPKKLWKCSKRWLKEDNLLGGILFYKSKLLGILYLDVPWSCRPYQEFNRYHLYRWQYRAYGRWGTGCKHLLQQCVSAQSDRKQGWQ